MANFTQQAIKQACITLLEKYPLNKISVKSIVEECGINRNSFYYHFQDIPAVIESIISEQTEKLIAAYPSITSLNECLRVACDYALEHKKVIMNIYNSVNKDYFIRAALVTCEQTVTNYIKTAFADVSVSQKDAEAIIRLLKCQIFGLIIEWINSGMPDNVLDDLDHLLEISKDIPDIIISRIKQ